MKALLINPENKTVTLINLDKGLEAIYKAMECECLVIGTNHSNGESANCKSTPESFSKDIIWLSKNEPALVQYVAQFN